MKIFYQVYRKVLAWSEHRYAPYYLTGLSFIESFIFPIPPDVMLIPMSLAQRHRALRYALITTVASVCGGLFGYWIGVQAFHFVHPYIEKFGYGDLYLRVQHWFQLWSFWILLIAGFSPIPYKLFTVTAGSLHVPLLPFILSSFLGRSGRFFGLALLIKWGGSKIDRWITQYLDRICWICLFIVALWLVYRWRIQLLNYF